MGFSEVQGSFSAIGDNLSITGNANVRYMEQDVQLNNYTIRGSSTIKAKIAGKNEATTFDAGLGIMYSSDDASIYLNANGYLSPVGDIDSMASVSAGFNIKF